MTVGGGLEERWYEAKDPWNPELVERSDDGRCDLSRLYLGADGTNDGEEPADFLLSRGVRLGRRCRVPGSRDRGRGGSEDRRTQVGSVGSFGR